MGFLKDFFVSVAGAGQVVLGGALILTGVGAPIGAACIGEGIGDIIYVASDSDESYGSHKVKSLTFTAATAAVGGAIGMQFANAGGQIAKSVAKEGGKVAAKKLAEKATIKVLEKTAQAAVQGATYGALLGAPTKATMKATSNANNGKSSGKTTTSSTKSENRNNNDRKNQKTSRQIQDKYIPDEESSDERSYRGNEEYRYRVRSVSQHILDRLTRVVRFAGYKQHLSEVFHISRLDIVRPGRSIYQDQNSNMGPRIHAAHVVRGGTINPVIEQRSPNYHFRILVNYLAHTQNIPAWANFWHGIGGDIDDIQEFDQHVLTRIDFNGHITQEARQHLRHLVNLHIDVLQNAIDSGRLDEDQIKELQEAIDDLNNMSMKDLFEAGRKGYKSDIMKRYLG